MIFYGDIESDVSFTDFNPFAVEEFARFHPDRFPCQAQTPTLPGNDQPDFSSHRSELDGLIPQSDFSPGWPLRAGVG